MQSAKIIDITRSFIPVDPNSFPETLHATDKEDSPEHRIPVVPYMGHNFLPTAAGYKSFFGTNSHIDIEALEATAKPDHVFLFQTATYANIAVALCDTGIWIADTTTAGAAWEQIAPLIAPGADTFFEWTFCTIKNRLYCFRSNNDTYYRISTDVEAENGLEITEFIPQFITATSQLGMFRLGARLAFWDGENAIAWSSPDELYNFAPSVITGANVTTFNSITGRIASIRPHGRHAVCYSSKGVILLQVEPSETFFVKAVPILENTGTAYAKQSVEGVPNTTHFCYTGTGIYKIESGKPELIVPEVFDYFKPYTSQPVYLKLLQGRYLAFEIMDANALNGVAQFSKEFIPSTSIVLEGFTPSSLDGVNAANPVDVNLCELMRAYDQGLFDEQTAAAAAAGVPPVGGRYPSSSVDPVYQCYIAQATPMPAITTWGSTPCGSAKLGGGTWTPSPVSDFAKLSKWSTDSTNKVLKQGSAVWLDGKWTMERFVAYQSAIWKAQEESLQSYVDEIAARTEAPVTVVTPNTNSCSVVAPTVSPCTIGRWPTEYSNHQFGFNKCSFWLTRYATAASDVKNNVTDATACANVSVTLPPTGYKIQIGGSPYNGTVYASEADCLAALVAVYAPSEVLMLDLVGSPPGNINASAGGNTAISSAVHRFTVGGSSAANLITVAFYQAATGKVTAQAATFAYPTLPQINESYPGGFYDKTQTQSSVNLEVPVAGFGVGAVETGYCVLTGWNYTNLLGNQVFVPSGTCDIIADKYPGGSNTPGATDRQVPSDGARPELTNAADGTVCGIPYEEPILAVGETAVTWPDETITYPDSAFTLQVGSIAPKFPTIVGSFVYDLHLKKWGKLKLDYKQLLDYSPINSESASPIAFANFGIIAGAFKADGLVYIFDDRPSDSQLTWGKIGYYRLGMTDLEEVRFDFASLSNGTVTVDLSMDGSAVGSDLSFATDFTNVKQVVVYPPYAGKWFNVTVSGKYDVVHLSVRGLHKGIR